MVKNFIFNLGYDTSHIISVVSSEGVSKGSKIILIAPEDRNDRQMNAVDDIFNYVSSLNQDIEIKFFNPEDSLLDNVGSFSKLFSDVENLVLSLSGGPRDWLIPMTIASNLSQDSIQKVYFRSDLDSELNEIDIPGLSPGLDESELEVLEAFEKEFKPVNTVVGEVSISESTIYRKLEDLEDRGLVEKTESEGVSLYRAVLSPEVF